MKVKNKLAVGIAIGFGIGAVLLMIGWIAWASTKKSAQESKPTLPMTERPLDPRVLEHPTKCVDCDREASWQGQVTKCFSCEKEGSPFDAHPIRYYEPWKRM